MLFSREDTGFRLMNIYIQTAGAFQVLYASFFGWVASPRLMWSAHQMIWVAQDGFRFRPMIGKGQSIPAFDLENFAEGAGLALLSLCSLIGAYGLLRLRSWARRWEIGYLVFLSVYLLAIVAIETRRGREIGYLVHAYVVLAVPYLPFLYLSPPSKFPPVDDVAGAKLAVADLDGL